MRYFSLLPNALLIVQCFRCKYYLIMSTANTVIITSLDGSYSNEVAWYGPNLRRTLTELTIEQLTYSDTYEGYTAWEVALHCAYWKWVVRRGLTGENDEFPYFPANFPQLHGKCTEATWMKDLQYIDEQHERLKNATRVLSDEQLESFWIDEHGVAQDGSVAHEIIGLALHDAYHTAQIRSMGIPGLAEVKRQ